VTSRHGIGIVHRRMGMDCLTDYVNKKQWHQTSVVHVKMRKTPF